MKPTKNVSSSGEENQGNKKQNAYILAAKAGDASKESTRKNQRPLEQTDQMKTDLFAVSCSHVTLGRGHKMKSQLQEGAKETRHNKVKMAGREAKRSQAGKSH